MKTSIHFLIISRYFLLKMRKFSDKIFREKQNAYFSLNNSLKKNMSFIGQCGKIL